MTVITHAQCLRLGGRTLR